MADPIAVTFAKPYLEMKNIETIKLEMDDIIDRLSAKVKVIDSDEWQTWTWVYPEKLAQLEAAKAYVDRLGADSEPGKVDNTLLISQSNGYERMTSFVAVPEDKLEQIYALLGVKVMEES